MHTYTSDNHVTPLLKILVTGLLYKCTWQIYGATAIKSGHVIVWKVIMTFEVGLKYGGHVIVWKAIMTFEVVGLKYGECTTNLLCLALLGIELCKCRFAPR